MSEIDPSYYHGPKGDLRSNLRNILSYNEYIGQAKFNIFKYTRRFEGKNGTGDLLKAKNYLEDLIDYYESNKEGSNGDSMTKEYTEKKLPVNGQGQDKANENVDQQKFVKDKRDKEHSKHHQEYLANK